MTEPRRQQGAPEGIETSYGRGRPQPGPQPTSPEKGPSRTSLIHGKYLVIRAGSDVESSVVIPGGAIFQRDGTIEDVGPYADLKARYQPDEEIGGPNFILIPGLVNAHHHGRGVTTIQLGTLDDSLETWILSGWGRRPVDHYLMSLYTAMSMVESGTTTVMYNQGPTPVATLESDVSNVLRGFGDAGMRVSFSLYRQNQNRVVYGDDEVFIESLPAELGRSVRSYLANVTMTDDDYFALFERTHARYGADPDARVRVLLSPSNVQWTSDDFLQRTKDYARRYDTGIHIHLMESHYQKLYGVRTWGKTPLAHLADLGFMGPEVSYAHGVWLTESDLGLLAAHGGTVCHNVSSNLRLKSGIAPVNRMLAHGINVAMGTDSDAINDDDDMVQEMRLVSKLHREPGIDAPAISSAQVLKMATANGASPTFFGERIGALEPGRRADVVLMDLSHIEEPYLDGESHILDALLYRGKARYVDTVIIDGRVVLRGGAFVHVDKADVVRQLREDLAGPIPERTLQLRRVVRELLPHVRNFYEDWEHQAAPPHYRVNSTA